MCAARRHHQIPEVGDLRTYGESILMVNRVSIYEGKTKGDFKPLDDGEVIAFKDWATSKLSSR
jgi:hypothetical protein